MINIYFGEGCSITDTNIVSKYTDNILIWLDYFPSVNTGVIFSLPSNGELSLDHLEFGLRKKIIKAVSDTMISTVILSYIPNFGSRASPFFFCHFLQQKTTNQLELLAFLCNNGITAVKILTLFPL